MGTSRTSKKLDVPTVGRPTRRGITPQAADEEPAYSTRPTRRSVVRPDMENTVIAPMPFAPTKGEPSARGQYSISNVRGIAAEVVAGEIKPRARRRTQSIAPPVADVRLVARTKRTLTVLIRGQELTIEMVDAHALADLLRVALG